MAQNYYNVIILVQDLHDKTSFISREPYALLQSVIGMNIAL